MIPKSGNRFSDKIMLKQKNMAKQASLPSADCFCLQARMTSRAITRHYNAALSPLDLEITELSLLAALAATQTNSIAALAERLAFERTTLVRNLKRLEGRKLIAAKNQGRAVNYALTADGRALLTSAVPLWRKAQSDISRKLATGDPADILTSLRSLRRAALKSVSGAPSGATPRPSARSR
jgi:DNA-binding MarR family transcriptional regulator